MERGNIIVYGNPNVHVNHKTRIYVLSALFAAFALTQWCTLGFIVDWRRFKMPPGRYGYWLMGTFFAICMLSCTQFGRRFPWNVVLVLLIVESSTLYIALEQHNTKSPLVNIYAMLIVFMVVLLSIVYGAYFPLRMVPGDLILSLGVALAHIMLILFFFNVYVIRHNTLYSIVRNFFAITAVTMIMYTATVIHDRQSEVAKSEYIYLSVILFFGQMILHERILSISVNSSNELSCSFTN